MAEQKQLPVAKKMVRPATPRPTTTTTMTAKEIFAILRRHTLLIVLITILGLITSGVLWYLLRKYMPRYTAQTYIRILSPVERDPMTIGERIVNNDIQYAARMSMAALIKQQITMQELIDRDKVQETEWFKSFGRIKSKRIAKAVKDLKKHFRAYAQRDGDFVITSMTCGDKREAALIVNEMVDLFLYSRGTTKRGEVAVRLTRLEEQRNRVKGELDTAERALDDVRERFGFTDLEVQAQYRRSTIQVKLDNLELEQNELLMDIKQLQTLVETLERQATQPINAQVRQQVERDATVVTLTRQLAVLETQFQSRLTRFGENHRVMQQAQEMINQTRREKEKRRTEIANQTRQANLLNGLDQLTVLQGKYEELENLRQQTAATKRDYDLARVQYQQRVSIRNERMAMLDEVKSQIEKLKIMHSDPMTPKVQFVAHAPEPLEVSSPKWEFYFHGGAVLGLMLGIGLAFLIELLNDLVRTPRDVARFLHIPLLGVIPDADEDDQVANINLCLTVQQAPYSATSEAYRRLRTNLKLSTQAESSKTLLISSGIAGDGKTSVAVNLATAFIADNKRVLVIDANFRQPNLHMIFPKQLAEQQAEQPEQAGVGLSDCLTGRCSYQQAIRPTGIDGLDIIDAGPLPDNPGELLGSAQMQELTKQQRQNYDYVIIDGPPLLLVSDTKMLARFVDGTILVFNAGTTRRGAAIRTIRELRQVNATIVGCVLFAVKALKGGYFAEQSRLYQKYQEPQLARAT